MFDLIFFPNVLTFIGDTIASALFAILLQFNCIIYTLINVVYQVFLVLAGGGQIFDKSYINGMVSRIYVIIGVIVLFLVAYSLLRSMVNPDEAIKGKKSPVNIVKDVVISIVLIAFVPSIFSFMFSLQDSLLKNNTIGKIIAGNQGGSDVNQTISQGGMEMAAGVWGAFIQVNPNGNGNGTFYCTNREEEENLRLANGEECVVLDIVDGITYGEMWDYAKNTGQLFWLVGIVPKILDDSVTYLFIVDSIAGIFVLFVLLSYCFDMALRLVKLAVYELIAPIPILARIVPGEQGNKVFSNWLKAVGSTFAEAFIRIAVLYFAVIIIATVASSIDNLFGFLVTDLTVWNALIKLVAQALIILGIIMFVKQFPQIFKEMTGLDSGKYNPIKSFKQGFGLVAGGAVGRSPMAAWRAYNEAGEAKKLTDFSAIGNQYKRRQAAVAARELQENAGLNGRQRFNMNTQNRVRQALGLGTLKEEADKRLENFRTVDGRIMESINDTGGAILDEHGNTLFADGSSIELNEKNVNRLLELKAAREQAKARIGEQVRITDDAIKVNKVYEQAKKDAEAEYESEVNVKNKFNLVEKDSATGKYKFLELDSGLVDAATGQKITFGSDGRTMQQYKDWLEGMKNQLTADKYTELKNKLNQSYIDDTKKFFIDNNGLKLLDNSGTIDQNLANRNRTLLDIKATLKQKHDFAGGKMKDVVYDTVTQTVTVTDDTTFDNLFAGNSADITFEQLSDMKDRSEGKELERNVKNVIQYDVDAEDTQIKRISRVVEQQPKEITAAEKAGSTYKAREAVDKAQEINRRAGNGH